MVMYPEVLVREMARIARHVVISFPNFGHVFNRLDLLLTGRMPRPQLFGYRVVRYRPDSPTWTAGFPVFLRRFSLRAINEQHIGRPAFAARLLPTLFARTSVYLCVKES